MHKYEQNALQDPELGTGFLTIVSRPTPCHEALVQRVSIVQGSPR